MAHVEEDGALVALLDRLKQLDYRFVPPTPETHRRVAARFGKAGAASLQDVFGWSRSFGRSVLPGDLFELLERAGCVAGREDQFRSEVRIASLGEYLFLHSAYPTDSANSVFFGPDSYRFARFLDQELAARPTARRLVDIGAGSGVGAIVAARHMPDTALVLTDINPAALRFARINARHNDLSVETLEGSGVEPVEGAIELAIANPPFIIDPSSRAYRDGGGMHGAALSLEWTLAAAARLTPGGRLLLYTGSAIIAGEDRLETTLRHRLASLGCSLRYAELDPDIFGEQLDEPGYEEVERIAAIGAVVTRAKG